MAPWELHLNWQNQFQNAEGISNEREKHTLEKESEREKERERETNYEKESKRERKLEGAVR